MVYLDQAYLKVAFLALLIIPISIPLTYAHGPSADDEHAEGVGVLFGDASANNGVYGENHGGYGFLSTSEAEAGAAFQFSCTDQAQRQYLGAACNRVFAETVAPEAIVTNSMRAMALGKLREQALEYYFLQIRGAKTAQGRPLAALTRPSCIPANSPVWTRVHGNAFVTGTQFDAKREAVEESLAGPNLAKAYLYSERLQKGIDDNDCKSFTTRNRNCTSLQYTKYRMQNSFPALWRHSIQGQGDGATRIDIGTQGSGTPAFKQAIARLLGTNGAAAGTSLADAQTRGEGFMAIAAAGGQNPGTSGITSYSDIESRFDSALSAAQAAPAGSLMQQALAEYNTALAGLQSNHESAMTGELAAICTNASGGTASARTTSTIYQLATMRPNIVRQALLDMSEPMRSLAKGVLCDSGVMPNIKREPQCEGVTGGPLPGPNPINIDRWKINDYPYGSQNTFKISRPATPANAPTTVNLSVNMVVGSGLAGMTDRNHNNIPDQMECKVKAWQSDVNDYLNCSTGAVASIDTPMGDDVDCEASGRTGAARARINPLQITTTQACPMHPGMQRTPNVRFNITLNPVRTSPGDPAVTVHRCFRTEIEGSDGGRCDKVREWNINACITSRGTAMTTCLGQAGMNESKCRKKIKKICTKLVADNMAAGGGWTNRADSSNYVLSEGFGTVRHEVLHLMGAPDEYRAGEKPFSQLGEHNSIMNNSNSLDSRIYPRHLDTILDVTNCTAVGGEG